MARRTKKDMEFHKALSAAVKEKALSPEVFQEVQAILDGHEKREKALEAATEQANKDSLRARRAEAALEKFQEDHADSITDVITREKAVTALEASIGILEARVDERLAGLEYSQNFALAVVRAPVFRKVVDTIDYPGTTEEEVDTRTRTTESQE